MRNYRITTVLHPNTFDSYQGLIWAKAHYCEGACFPWLLLTPTQLVMLARAGRITLLALLETTADELAAITGCDDSTAAELARRIAADGAYWTDGGFNEECRAMDREIGGSREPDAIDFAALRAAHPEYRAPAQVELLPQPGPPFPWPKDGAWEQHMSRLIVGQFEDGGFEIRNLLNIPEATVPGRLSYLTDPHVVASYEARRGELKRDLERLADDAKRHELAEWLVRELRGELRDIENYLDRWLPAHRPTT